MSAQNDRGDSRMPADAVEKARPRFFVGIDVGTRNLGLAVYEPDRRCARLMSIDLLVDPDNGLLVQMEERITELLASRVVDELGFYLERAIWVGIEKQMKRRFQVLAEVLRTIINERYGGICVDVAPQSVRAFFGIRGTNYDQRKDKSGMLVQRFLDHADFFACQVAFNKRKDGQNHVDTYEALLIALWLAAHRATMTKPRPVYKRVTKRGPALKRYRVMDVTMLSAASAPPVPAAPVPRKPRKPRATPTNPANPAKPRKPHKPKAVTAAAKPRKRAAAGATERAAKRVRVTT